MSSSIDAGLKIRESSLLAFAGEITICSKVIDSEGVRSNKQDFGLSFDRSFSRHFSLYLDRQFATLHKTFGIVTGALQVRMITYRDSPG